MKWAVDTRLGDKRRTLQLCPLSLHVSHLASHIDGLYTLFTSVLIPSLFLKKHSKANKLISCTAVPDLLRNIGKKCEPVFNPHKAIKDFFSQVGAELLETSCSLGVQRDLVASVVVSEDEPGLFSYERLGAGK
jgi:hypothetical protein